MTKEENEKKAVVLYNNIYLSNIQRLGISKVDPSDIRPPSMLLIQKSSDLSLFIDKNGKEPKIGQFFHTGRLQIIDTFECYIIFSAKSKYIDKIKPQEGEKDQYKAIGIMSDDLTLFGMTFRSSSLFTLSPLFTASVANKRPVFSIKVKFETKGLQNDKGSWTVPVLRIIGMEENPERLGELEKTAIIFDQKAEELVKADLEDINLKEMDETFNKPVKVR